MSLYIDLKYLMEISYRLPKFKKKSEGLYNCRCVICGDSQSNPNRARGFFYKQKQDLFYKCHNCSASKHFGTFLKDFDDALYKQYVFERYAKGENGPKAHKSAEKFLKFDVPVFKKLAAMATGDKRLEQVAERLDALPDDNEAVAYCLTRGIGRQHFRKLWYLPRAKDILTIAPEKYQERSAVRGDAPKLLIPLYSLEGELTGVSLRALRGEAMRYLLIKFDEEKDLLFGLPHLDKTKPITVVEGALDSLFLENAIAANGVAFGKIESLGVGRDNITLVFDNQPRNKDVVREVRKYVEAGHRVCIWPCGITQKDINEMVQAGLDPARIIKEHTYQGLMAQAMLANWKNCP